MASDDPGQAKTPRPSRKHGPKASTTGHLPASEVKAETEAPPLSIDHLTASTARHLRALDRERRQYLDDIKGLRAELNQARRELDHIRPELATVRERLRNTEWATMIASVFIAIGGAAVSAAGYFDASARRAILTGGVATLTCGLVLQVVLGRRSNGARTRNVSRSE